MLETCSCEILTVLTYTVFIVSRFGQKCLLNALNVNVNKYIFTNIAQMQIDSRHIMPQLHMLHASTVILGTLEQSNRFVDVLDAQWACEGELIPLDVQTLNPREFLVYQHGLFLLKMLHTLKLVSVTRAAPSQLILNLFIGTIPFYNCTLSTGFCESFA